MIITVVLSQVISAVGYGEYFPWAIPALYSGLLEENVVLSWGNFIIILVTSLLGLFGTLYWWLFADQH